MNKGVVVAILSDKEMPRDNKGVPFDIIMNPAGIPSRKNVGQLIELYAGRIIKHVEKLVKNHIKESEYKKAIQEILKINELLQPKSKFKVIKEKISKLSKDDIEKFLSNVYSEGLPLIVDPMHGLRLESIINAYRYYGLNTKEKIYDPYIGRKTKSPVSFGWLYWSKTEHLGDKGLHARSIGITQESSRQATQGSKKEGGQRIGELDMYGLMGYGLNDYFKEIVTLLSDDIDMKNKAIRSIYKNGYVSINDLKDSKSYANKQLLAYLVCMGVYSPENI